MTQLHIADFLILAGYLIAVIIICARVTERSPDADDLFLASR